MDFKSYLCGFTLACRNLAILEVFHVPGLWLRNVMKKTPELIVTHLCQARSKYRVKTKRYSIGPFVMALRLLFRVHNRLFRPARNAGQAQGAQQDLL